MGDPCKVSSGPTSDAKAQLPKTARRRPNALTLPFDCESGHIKLPIEPLRREHNNGVRCLLRFGIISGVGKAGLLAGNGPRAKATRSNPRSRLGGDNHVLPIFFSGSTTSRRHPAQG